MRTLLWAALSLTVLLGVSLSAQAQQASVVTTTRASTTSAPDTLAAGLQALPSGVLPNNRLLLTVAPDQVISQADEQAREAWQKTLFTENPSPPPVPAPLAKTLDALAAQFDCRMQTFGQVTALAPTTRIALADPTALNLSANHLPLEQALKLLLGSLTPAQMQQLGGNGLGPEDLSDDQLSFFEAVVSHPLRIMPVGARPPVYDPKKPDSPDFQAAANAYMRAVQTLSPQTLSTARLHARLLASYTFMMPGGNEGVGASPQDSIAPSDVQYQISNMITVLPASDPQVRREVPNMPRDSDLLLAAAAFSVPLPVSGLKTVGDLVAQAGAATHQELYCDPHYAARSLVWLGDTSQTVPAADLLRALDLCLPATWRAVGPAFVLTDDREGMAARRQRIKDAADDWGAQVGTLMRDAARRLADARWYDQLSFAPGDSAALPPNFVSQLIARRTVDAWQADLPFSGLPLAVQGELRSRLQTEQGQNPDQEVSYQDIHEEQRNGRPFMVFGSDHTITRGEQYQRVLDGLGAQYKVGVGLDCRFALDVPGVGLVALDRGDGGVRPPFPATPPKPDPDSAAKAVVLTLPMRGLLAAPQTPAQARTVVDRMAALGLNTLFCRVFADGRTFFANTAVPPAGPDTGGVLSAAIAEGQAKHVAVYALLDGLRWAGVGDTGTLPGAAPEDRTVTGETARQSLARQSARHPADAVEWQWTPPPPAEAQRLAGAWVSPAESVAAQTLEALARQAAQTPGVAGVALQDTRPPGYNPAADSANIFGPRSPFRLGFGPTLRLAFLRTRHADPLDVTTEGDVRVTLGDPSSLSGIDEAPLDLSVPSFDAGEEAAKAVAPAWLAFRAAQADTLAARLAAAASAPGRPVFLRPEALPGARFTSWSLPNAPSVAAVLLSVVNDDLDHPGQVAQSLRSAEDAGRADMAKARPAANQSGGALHRGVLLDITASDLNQSLDGLSQIMATSVP